MFGPVMGQSALLEVRTLTRRLLRRVVVYLAAGLCASVGLGFLVAAIYIQLMTAYGAAVAAAIVGAGLVAVAGVAVLVARRDAGRRVPGPLSRERPAAAGRPGERSGQPAGGILGLPAAAFALGLMAGRRARTRRR